MRFGKKLFKGLAKFFDFLAEEEKKNDVVEEKELKVIEKKAAAEEKGKYNAWLIFKAAFLGALAIEIVKIIFTILENLVTLPSVMEKPDFLQIIVNVFAGKADAVAELELMICRFAIAYGVISSIMIITALISVMISSDIKEHIIDIIQFVLFLIQMLLLTSGSAMLAAKTYPTLRIELIGIVFLLFIPILTLNKIDTRICKRKTSKPQVKPQVNV